MNKFFKQFTFIAMLMVLVVMSGGCGGGSDSNHASNNVINAPGATLPADPDHWTTEEKAAWVNQGTLLLDRITSEEFEGRMTGAAGYEKAANFAAENFKAWGLEPLNGSYFQDFSISYSMPVKTSPVINIYVDGTLWKSTANGDYIDDEFVKDIMSAHGTNTGTARGKVTFLGYGIDATADNEYANSEYDHINPATVYRNNFNEYVGLTWNKDADPTVDTPNKNELDVTDRFVIFRNATPNQLSNVDYRPYPILGGELEPEEYQYAVGNDWIRHDEHYVKISVARQRGAAGVLYNQMVANPNIRYQPTLEGKQPFQIVLIGSIGRDLENGTLSETTYTKGTGDSKLLNDLFAKQLEIEEASNGEKHTLTDLIERAKTVQKSTEGGNGPVLTIPTKDFGDGKGSVPDYAHLLYNATTELFRGPDATEGAANGPYDNSYDASIATNSFHFDDSIEIEITTETETKVDARGMNVVGVIRGSELPDEYVIYMTHFDHTGYVGPYMAAGAADNGAGSTANMIAARYAAMLAADGNRPKRSLVFILDGGEESGMSGSKTAAAWFAANGRDKVKAVFHTDSTFGKGSGAITVTTSMMTTLAPLADVLLDSSQGRLHPWGDYASDFSPESTTITMATPTSTSQPKYIGRPRTDTAAWQDADIPVVINVSAKEENSITSLYHAPYDDRDYVSDRLPVILGIATAENMFTVANQ